jgi:deoxycytidylate deaminase
LVGATLYVTREPCYACDKLIQGAGVHAVVWPKPEARRAEKAIQAARFHARGSSDLSWVEDESTLPVR